MRLLHTASILEPGGPWMTDFPPDKLPPYAILSHTWGDDEVIYSDMQAGKAQSKAAFRKISYTCRQALSDGLNFAWIDSCCIDKSSSAELSEAINSMYKWYEKAELCYAFLADVSATTNPVQRSTEFAGSRWFTRGWTLQELLAPVNLAFFNCEWTRIGEKMGLSKIISETTGIDEQVLTGAKAMQAASVARRMSWAAVRQTTRKEDSAYCLMGLFEVNMPMLYGEGDRAFVRLQEEIMKNSDDQSLFAWVNPDASSESYHGLLAKSPRDFAYSNSIFPYEDWEPRPPYSMGNRGLCIEFPIRNRDEGGDIYLAALDCPAPPDYEDSSFLAIYLKKLSHGDERYARVNVGQFAKVKQRGTKRTIYIRQDVGAWVAATQGIFPRHIMQLRGGSSGGMYKVLKVMVPPGHANDAPKPVMSSRDRSAREWVPKTEPITFRNPKGACRLAGAVHFSHIELDRELIVMIGSMTELIAGFSALELPLEPWGDPSRSSFDTIDDAKELNARYRPDFGDLEKRFTPLPLGQELELSEHRVRVEAEVVVANSSKYLFIDIYVERVERTELRRAAFLSVRRGYRAATGQSAADDPPPQGLATPSEETIGTGELKTKKSTWKKLFALKE